MTSARGSGPIQVLVVDDSAVVRQVLKAVLSRDPNMVVTVASDPLIAMQKMKQTRPNVILLDLEMPRMDGLTFLRKIMTEDPIPTLVCSGVAAQGTTSALRALDEGAVDIVTKPNIGVRDFLHESSLLLIDLVRSAAQIRVRQRAALPVFTRHRPPTASILPKPAAFRDGFVVAIGASTGGPEALTEILTAMPKDAPGIVIVQHMPEHFTAAFARRLNGLCEIEVKEAQGGDEIVPGRAIIAPGNHHLSVARRGRRFEVSLSDGPLVSRHRPSVDVLFQSVAETAGANSLGVILTGMGSDGAAGLWAMKQAGAQTIAQDETTCIVFGMPKEAISCSAADSVVPLPQIPKQILQASAQARAERERPDLPTRRRMSHRSEN